MKTKFSFLLAIALFFGGIVTGQSPVKFLDTGGLISTPGIADNEEEVALLVSQVGKEAADEIIEYCEEKNWPPAISTLNGRNAIRPVISNYKAWVVADFKSSVMLIVPAKENQHMPADMRPTRNIYFLITDNSIQNGESYTRPQVKISDFPNGNVVPSVTTSASTEPKGFDNQLNYMITQLPAGFESLRGKKVEKDKDDIFLNEEWDSKIQLEGSERTYISKTRFGGAYNLIAVYGNFRTRAETDAAYKELVAKVSNSALPCCSLAENETNNETITSTYWLPFDLSGKMDPGLKDMVLEVQWMKNIAWDSDFNTYDEWRLILRIGNQ